MKHILIATGLYAPEIGGPATHTRILEMSGGGYGMKVTPLPFARVRKYPKVIRHMMYLYHVIKESRRATHVYALDPVSVGVPSYIGSALTGKLFILRVAGDYAWEQARGRFGCTDTLDVFSEKIKKDRGHYGFMVRILYTLETFVASRATKVVVPSMYLKKIVCAWGVSEDRVHVVYNTLETMAIDDEKEVLKKKHNIEGISVVSVGRLVPWKGYQTLIDVVSELRSDVSEVQLYIVGDGPEERSLRAYAEEKGAEAYVHFLGKRDKKETLEIMKAGDVFALNTAYEGFSHTILEAMSVGTPVVTTDVCGNKELVEDGKNGRLVGCNDAGAFVSVLKQVIEDSDMRRCLKKNAHEAAHSFSEERMMKSLAQLFSHTI